jgi:hypothetical protein
MTDPREILDEIGHDLADEHPGVERGRIFRSTGFKVGGRYFAFANDEGIVLKLPEARVRALVDTGGGAEFTSGPRVMREWVRVPGGPGLPALVAEAHAFLAG